ncbi:unnamed protein product, partial [Rotaria sordida]
YSSGAPSSACTSMLPRHGVSSQQCSSKYLIESDKLQYHTSDTVRITVRGSTNDDTFRGILLVAKTKTNQQIIGTWSVVGSDIKTLNCGGIDNTGITHNSPSDKLSIEALWHPPSAIIEDSIVINDEKEDDDDSLYLPSKPAKKNKNLNFVAENPSTISKSESTIKSSFYPTTNIRRKWWKESVAYQIYPRSFQDSNGDGIGDIRGIIQRLDHIKNLGADLVWICPISKSANDVNGYDISDYQDIMDVFGTMEDVDELIKQIHNRNMRIIFDLVLNHTNDEHPWFIESRSSRTSSKRDCIFNGSGWEYDKETGQYYLHLFSRKMPDVNWECQELRQELYKMTRWWLDRGVDGFRIDAISHIKKKPGLPD